jgi:hypothetical protein
MLLFSDQKENRSQVISRGNYRIVRYPMTAKAANDRTAMIIPIRDIRLSLLIVRYIT